MKASREATVGEVVLSEYRAGSLRLYLFTLGRSLAEVAIELPISTEDAATFRPGDIVIVTVEHKDDAA